MPDLDTGHIFLTTLAPIKDGTCLDAEGKSTHTSYRQMIRNALVELPVARQSPATEDQTFDSPFSRNLRTHLARMFVLDDVVYNGREGHDAIVSSLKALTGDKAGANPALPQHTDYLNCSYLVFCAEVDAVTRDGAPLPTTLSAAEQTEVRRSYAEELWRTMGAELRVIYRNCVGFDAVTDAKGFADYLERCHVETTMPFHDYYIGDVTGAFHRLPLKALAATVLIPALVALIALVLAVIGWHPGWMGNPFWWIVIAGGLACLAFVGSVKYAIANGEKPLPPGPYDDLPSVLKALYVQQRFSDLAIDLQGATPDQIHAAFGAWTRQHKPADRSGPTQVPGVIRTPDDQPGEPS